MNLTEVKKSLDQQFARPLAQGSKRNIIFWYDENGEFADVVDNLDLENAQTIKLYNNNMFATKLHIEETDRENNLLVYSPLPRPDNRDNWLTDTIKYSQTFSTDITSIHLLNFGIDNALRSVVDKYKVFFGEKNRSERFASYALAPYTEYRIDLGVLSSLCKLKAPNIDNVVRTLLTEMVHGEKTIYESIIKFGNMDTFWLLMKEYFGYTFEEQSLEKLAIFLLCSHLSRSIAVEMPKDWQAYVSDNSNCLVFVDEFMKNSQHWENYNQLAVLVAEKLGLSSHADKWLISDIADCDTFADFDRSIINRINGNITQSAGEYGFYRRVINSRKNRRYYKHFETEYDALFHACEYFDLTLKHKNLPGANTLELFENYAKDFYKFDSEYRRFVAAYDRLHDADSFAALFEMLEQSYTNSYLNDLSVKWCEFWEGESRWYLSGITPQQGFYNRYVHRYVADSERIVVIISDGLRYESAVQLNGELNRGQKGKSELDVMLGVIPSYTALGMAALLPHKTLEITSKGDFEIKGISTEGTANREKILQTVKKEAFAIRAEEILSLNQQQLHEKLSTSGNKLIYIYHNTIDARGDNASTENEVFEATEKAFGEICTLVRKLRTLDLSIQNIVITADHGYIYRRTPLEERNKTPKEDLAGVKSKRRFIMARENLEQPGCMGEQSGVSWTTSQGTQSFPMSYLDKNSVLYAILPRSTNCFKVSGSGSRYVHGGTSLQEVVIPVIRFRSDKKANPSMNVKKVSVSVTSLSHKVTSIITHLTFFQNEIVSDKHLPIRITAYFEDESGNRISNENIIIADSTSKEPQDRAYKEKFTLKNMAYDKAKNYFLVLKDEEEAVNQELERIPFVIDLVFGGNIRF